MLFPPVVFWTGFYWTGLTPPPSSPGGLQKGWSGLVTHVGDETISVELHCKPQVVTVAKTNVAVVGDASGPLTSGGVASGTTRLQATNPPSSSHFSSAPSSSNANNNNNTFIGHQHHNFAPATVYGGGSETPYHPPPGHPGAATPYHPGAEYHHAAGSRVPEEIPEVRVCIVHSRWRRRKKK